MDEMSRATASVITCSSLSSSTEQSGTNNIGIGLCSASSEECSNTNSINNGNKSLLSCVAEDKRKQKLTKMQESVGVPLLRRLSSMEIDSTALKRTNSFPINNVPECFGAAASSENECINAGISNNKPELVESVPEKPFQTPEEVVNWLCRDIENEQVDSDISWFAENGYIMRVAERQKSVFVDQKIDESYRDLIRDHFDQLISDLDDTDIPYTTDSSGSPNVPKAGKKKPREDISNREGAEERRAIYNAFLSLNALRVIGSSLIGGSRGHYKPDRDTLHKLFYRIAQNRQSSGEVRGAAFALLRRVIAFWPPIGRYGRLYWLKVLVSTDFNPQSMDDLIDKFRQQFLEWIESFEEMKNAKSVTVPVDICEGRLTLLADLLEYDLAVHAVQSTDNECDGSNVLKRRHFFASWIIAGSDHSGAFWPADMKRLLLVARLFMKTQSLTTVWSCGRILSVCFETRRLMQMGNLRPTAVSEIPYDLCRNVEDLLLDVAKEFGIESARKKLMGEMKMEWVRLVFERAKV